MLGSRRASIVFPAPGGPTMTTLCPPDAAISSARLAVPCPTTSAKSSESRVARARARRRLRARELVAPKRRHELAQRFRRGELRRPHQRRLGDVRRREHERAAKTPA